MLSQEIIDNMGEGHFDELVLENIDHTLVDVDIDDEFEAEDAFLEDSSLLESADHIFDI